MKLYISKDKIETFCGNVFSLRLVSEYRVLSSLDGISYTPCAKGVHKSLWRRNGNIF